MRESAQTGPLHGFLNEIAGADAGELAARLTLLYLLFKPDYSWFAHVPLLVLAACGLFSRKLATNRWLWLALTLLTATKIARGWDWVDNHFYLTTYWCLALFCSFSVEPARRALALNGRLLIALVFGIATFWRVALSPDFVNAAFFRDMLLTDPRFLDLSSLVGGLDPLTREENIVSLSRLMQPDPGVYSTTLQEPQTLYWLAWLFTGWVIFIESLVAVLFLWPPSRLPAALRHAALLLFCWTTYAIGTVPGFGWLLMAMAIAQCEPERRTTRLLYFWTFFLILVYARVPWSAFLVRWIG